MRTIAHLSDLHFGQHDAAVADALVTCLERLRPDVIVVSGDFTQRARPSQFAEARKFLDQLTAPKVVVPGNHDVPLFNLLARFASPLVNYDRHIAPAPGSASFYTDDQIAILGLNTARRLTRKNGRVSLEQIEQIRSGFIGISVGATKVLVTHHPLGEPIGGMGLELAGRYRPALAAIVDAGVDILLSGHHHRATNGAVAIGVDSEHSILIVHAGTAISNRTRGREGNTFNLLGIESGRVSLTIFGWDDSSLFNKIKAADYLRIDGIWQPSSARS